MTRDELFCLLANSAPSAGWDSSDLNKEILLSSLDVILITACLYEKHGIRIPSGELKRENFHSAEAIWQLCKKITGGYKM